MTAETPTLWCVNIHGPDDVIAVARYLDAVKMANAFNAWWLDLREKKPLHEQYDARMWAAPLEWPYSAEIHAEAVASPADEYDWLRGVARSGIASAEPAVVVSEEMVQRGINALNAAMASHPPTIVAKDGVAIIHPQTAAAAMRAALNAALSHAPAGDAAWRAAFDEMLAVLKLVLEVGLADEDGAGLVEDAIYAAVSKAQASPHPRQEATSEH